MFHLFQFGQHSAHSVAFVINVRSRTFEHLLREQLKATVITAFQTSAWHSGIHEPHATGVGVTRRWKAPNEGPLP
jgi:hypothetical protein